MTLLFWILVGLIAYAYAGYPLLIMLLSRTVQPRPTPRIPEDADWPSVSILIPAYNEERIIAAKIENALQADYPAGRKEVMVASESDDGTDAIAARYEGSGVRVLPSRMRRGKVANLNRAVPHATGEILVFTDANAMFARDALRMLVRHFADPRIGSVSGRLVYRRAGESRSAYGEETYWDFEMMVKRASSRLGSLPGANGSLFALRRGLHRPMSETRGDDFELPIRVILAGYDSILEPAAVSEEEPSTTYLDEYRRKVRIINHMVVSALMLLREACAGRRWLIAFQLVSHKLNRWAVPFWLLALLPISLYLWDRGIVYQAAAAAQLLVYLLALAGFLARTLGSAAPWFLALPLYFVVVNSAAFAGIVSRAAGRDVRWHKRVDRTT